MAKLTELYDYLDWRSIDEALDKELFPGLPSWRKHYNRLELLYKALEAVRTNEHMERWWLLPLPIRQQIKDFYVEHFLVEKDAHAET